MVIIMIVKKIIIIRTKTKAMILITAFIEIKIIIKEPINTPCYFFIHFYSPSPAFT